MDAPEDGPVKAGMQVRAFVGGVVCGEATVDGQSSARPIGFSRLIVPSHALANGCGRPGATVSFFVDGIQSETTAQWSPGVHQISLALPATQPSPAAPAQQTAGPVSLPRTGSEFNDTFVSGADTAIATIVVALAVPTVSWFAATRFRIAAGLRRRKPE
jgi:hypothetical protein